MKTRITYICISLIMCGLFAYAETTDEMKNLILLDNDFFFRLSKTHPVDRDSNFGGHINAIVQGKAVVVSFDEKTRYKRKYRIVLEEREATQYKIRVIYNIFLENKDTLEMLSQGGSFEFRGQMMTFTPLNTERSSYIVDVVLQEGALVLE